MLANYYATKISFISSLVKISDVQVHHELFQCKETRTLTNLYTINAKAPASLGDVIVFEFSLGPSSQLLVCAPEKVSSIHICHY